MNKKEIQKWDVSDIDPVTAPLKDCRLYNGGYIATKKEQSFWSRRSRKKSDIVSKKSGALFIDRIIY